MDYASLELLTNALGEHFSALFQRHAQEVPKMYVNSITLVQLGERARQKHGFSTPHNYGRGNAAHYLHSIGRTVFHANKLYEPSLIASIFAEFISPELVRAKLLEQEHGNSVVLLSEEDIGVIFAVSYDQMCCFKCFI